MNGTDEGQATGQAGARRKWVILIVTSLAMIVAGGTTFSGLGIVLYAMAPSFHWTGANVGAGFTILVVAACSGSLLPIVLIPRIGARWTMVAGCLILAGGCALAADTSGLRGLYVAIALTGMGYSLVANAPSIYLLAGWSGSRAPRMIGLYLMAGTLGGVIIPPFAQFLVAGAGGWQNYWITMAIVAASLAILCALAIAEPVPIAPPTMGNEEQHDIGAESRWTFTTIFRSPRFLILAVALVASQTCVMTIASIAPAHLVSFGWTVEIAARLLALQGFVATIATGISGFLTRRFAPRTMLISALLAGTVAMLLFAYPYGWYSLIAFALLFGLSWSLVTLSVIVLMIGIFGDIGGTTAIATMWMLAGLAAFGPWVAGLSADANLGFASVLAGLGILLVPIALIIPFLVSARLISPKV